MKKQRKIQAEAKRKEDERLAVIRVADEERKSKIS